MHSKYSRSLLLFSTLCLFTPLTTMAETNSSILNRPVEHVKSIFHTGLWVEDADEMLAFLAEVMDYRIVLRAERRAGGERIIIEDSRGQKLELLSAPGEVAPHPELPLHPTGKVAGVAHISVWVENAMALEEKLVSMGYEILGRIPDSYDDGYSSFEGKEFRVLFVNGPGAMTFELFEVKD